MIELQFGGISYGILHGMYSMRRCTGFTENRASMGVWSLPGHCSFCALAIDEAVDDVMTQYIMYES
jgi:hypothetical protein